MAKLLVPLVMLGAVAAAGGGSLGPGGSGGGVGVPSHRCPPRCLCPAAAPSPTLLCARTGLLAVPPSLDRGAVELRLADNFIGAVGRADFANMSSLVHLTLSRNGLRRLAPGAFADLRALRALHLDGNRLPALSGAQLRGLASLRHLILANNQLAAIEPGAFAAFAATVEDLDLSHNNLPALPWDAVAAMASLATLTLDHNLLERVPAGAVARLPRLARLDLTANRLRALPPNGSRRAVGADGSSVELRVATLGDHGHFTCVASNAAGEAAARVRVDVLPLPVPPNGDNGDAGDANGPPYYDQCCGGAVLEVAPGDDFPYMPLGWADRVSSLVVGTRCQLTVWSRAGKNGKSRSFSAGAVPRLQEVKRGLFGDWNNAISGYYCECK
ncbi:hypothetical protein Q9233_017722 [Columba guinea]|nr:hypothetical protein Q9233_017722 [Columba guinea]